MLPRPPCLRGVLVLWKHTRKSVSNKKNLIFKFQSFKQTPRDYQAKWEKCESTEAAMTSHPIFLKSSAASLNAIISVGHTKVKSRG